MTVAMRCGGKLFTINNTLLVVISSCLLYSLIHILVGTLYKCICCIPCVKYTYIVIVLIVITPIIYHFFSVSLDSVLLYTNIFDISNVCYKI